MRIGETGEGTPTSSSEHQLGLSSLFSHKVRYCGETTRGVSSLGTFLQKFYTFLSTFRLHPFKVRLRLSSFACLSRLVYVSCAYLVRVVCVSCTFLVHVLCVYCALECVPMYIFCARVCLLCVGVYSYVFCARVWAWVELEQHWVRIIWVEIRDGGKDDRDYDDRPSSLLWWW